MSEDDDFDPRMTLGQHLEELRWRVLKSIGFIAVAAVICMFFQKDLMTWATGPHHRVMGELQRDARLSEAPKDSRDLLFDLLEGQKDLQLHVERADRTERRLLAAAESPEPELKGLRKTQEELAAKFRALAEELQAVDPAKPDLLAVSKLSVKRRALVAEVSSLTKAYEAVALPFVDQRARSPDMRFVDLKYQGPFLSYLKLALVVAVFLASPLVAQQLWGFIAVGLYQHEKRHINVFGPLSLFLFACGGAFGYFVLIPVGLYFLATYAPPDLMSNAISLSDYLSLFITLTVVVGLIFELPLIMSFLCMIGVADADTFRKYRQYFWLCAPIVGAVLTPPDPFTQMLLAGPMVLLYEVGILSCILIGKRKPKEEVPPKGGPPSALVDGEAPSDDLPPDVEEELPENDGTEEDDARAEAEAAAAAAAAAEGEGEDEAKVEDEPEAEVEELPLIRPVEQPRVARGQPIDPVMDQAESDAGDAEEASAGEGDEASATAAEPEDSVEPGEEPSTKSPDAEAGAPTDEERADPEDPAEESEAAKSEDEDEETGLEKVPLEVDKRTAEEIASLKRASQTFDEEDDYVPDPDEMDTWTPPEPEPAPGPSEPEVAPTPSEPDSSPAESPAAEAPATNEAPPTAEAPATTEAPPAPGSETDPSDSEPGPESSEGEDTPKTP